MACFSFPYDKSLTLYYGIQQKVSDVRKKLFSRFSNGQVTRMALFSKEGSTRTLHTNRDSKRDFSVVPKKATGLFAMSSKFINTPFAFIYRG